MKYAIVNSTIGFIKSKLDKFSENADEVLFGMNVEILEALENDWYYIRTHYNYEGYIDGSTLLIDDNKAKEYESKKNAMVLNNFADVLDKPKASGFQIATITRGSHIVCLKEVSENNRFVKVKLPDGRIGWTRKDFLCDLKTDYDIKDEKNLRENLVMSALSYLGTQYRWGGKTPMGIDCSGLCSMAYMLNGILIYRDANIKEGFPIREIARNELKKGDLIFFPGHVAMYLGNKRYVHSATSNNVVAINSFDKKADNYYDYLDKADKRFGSIF